MNKNLLLKIILLIEISIFAFFYILGPNSIKIVYNLNEQNNRLLSKIDKLNLEIENLELQMKLFNNNSFYKEKIARELLQMAHKKEEIYILT